MFSHESGSCRSSKSSRSSRVVEGAGLPALSCGSRVRSGSRNTISLSSVECSSACINTVETSVTASWILLPL